MNRQFSHHRGVLDQGRDFEDIEFDRRDVDGRDEINRELGGHVDGHDSARTLGDHSDHLSSDARESSSVDTNAVRWVFAATIAFWLVVFVAGKSIF